MYANVIDGFTLLISLISLHILIYLTCS